MDALQAYYNNLFGIEVTTLGIMTAGIFVFLQILHQSFSYKDMLFSMRRVSVVIYAILSFFVVGLTGWGSLFFATATREPVPWCHYTIVRVVFESDFTATLVLFVFLISAGLGIYVIYGTIKLLNPTSLLHKHLGALDNKSIARFLYRKYGVPEPFPHMRIVFMALDKKGRKKRPKKEEKEKEQEDEAKFTKEREEYERLKNDAVGAPDVFEGFTNILSRAIAAGDTGTVRDAIAGLISTMKGTLSNADSSFPINYLARYTGESLSTFLEMCRRHDMWSLSPQFIRASREIALLFLSVTDATPVKEILKSWKDQADTAIRDSDRPLFREIIQSFKEVADKAFGKEDKSFKGNSDVLDESFRCLGWLAERLLAQRGLQARPVMHDSDYEDEFGVLFNAIFHFQYKFNNNKADAYPLIYFDAVHVLFDSLLEIYKQPADEVRHGANIKGEIKDHLFSCAHVYSSFAADAIKAGNGDGAALAAINLRQVYESALSAGAEGVARDCLDLIVTLAIRVATNIDTVKMGHLDNPLGNLEKTILASSYVGTVESAVNESYRKFDEGPHDKKWEYIKSLGVKMGTNFGFMFDSRTGQDYAKDDPRRG